MKKAFSTITCQELTYKEVAKHAKEAGIHALEVRLHNGNRFFDLDVEEVPAAVDYLEQHGLHVVDLGTNIALCYDEPAIVEDAKKCVDLAVLTKAKAIRVFLGSFVKKFSEQSLHDYADIVKMLKEICAYAMGPRIEIWMETHNAFSEGKVLAQLIEDVAYENLKVIWDVMHPYEFEETPEETIQYLGDRIAHVHIKDGVKKEDPDLILLRYTKLGEGTVPVPEIISLLKARGYDGYYSLEWERVWREEIRDVFLNLPEILEHFNDYIKTFHA